MLNARISEQRQEIFEFGEFVGCCDRRATSLIELIVESVRRVENLLFNSCSVDAGIFGMD